MLISGESLHPFMKSIKHIIGVWALVLAAITASYIALQTTGAIVWIPPVVVLLLLGIVFTWGFKETISVT